MACVALTCLMATIELEFLQPIPRLSPPKKAAINSLFEKLSSLQAFLHKESNNDGDGGGASIKDLEIKIRDFALKAEDAIETQLSNLLLAKHNKCKKKASQELNQTLQEAAENAGELLKTINNISNNETDESNNETQPSFRLVQPSSKVDYTMVGRHHDYKVIKDKLLYGSLQRQITIVGMAGIGKTALARSVYEDPEVTSLFYLRCWITVPQGYSLSQTLCDLLHSITQVDPKGLGSNPFLLAHQVRQCLQGKMYLIVLDNFVCNQDWFRIQHCFPRGGYVLVTTRHHIRDHNFSDNQCISKITFTSSVYIHNMTLLDPNESWCLFCNVFSPKKYMVPELEKIRSHVVEKCDGLPLLIIVVAERLSKCNNIKKGWEKIEKELESLGILHRSTFAFSYNQLPQYLKVCFLYFVVFPKRSEIPIKMLIRLWIAEGIMKSSMHEDLENQAYRYLLELIDRSLVLINNRSSNGKIKTCKMHSALHTFCVGEAQKEGLFCAINTRQHLGLSLNDFASSSYWLSLYTHSFDYYVLFSTNTPRSLFFFHENHETFIPFKLLRVLVFVSSPLLQRVPMHLGDLVFLRYLSVTQWYEGLDDVVSTNLNLQTLIVSCNESNPGALQALHLPSTIWELPLLRHLELGSIYTMDPPTVTKRNLRTLSWVSPTPWRKKIYLWFPNMLKLKIRVKDDLEFNHTRGSCNNPIILDSLKHLKGLEKLTILVSTGCATTLSKQYMFPSQLTKLRLSGINLFERDLTIIGMLEWLEVLKLENVYHGRVWEVAETKFRRLRFLLLEAKELERLMAHESSFLFLERLTLRLCYCLEEIPTSFSDSDFLQSIELEQCGPSVVAFAKQIQELQHKRGNKLFEVRNYNLFNHHHHFNI